MLNLKSNADNECRNPVNTVALTIYFKGRYYCGKKKLRKLRNIFRKFATKSCVHSMLRGVVSKLHKKVQNACFCWTKKKYIEARNCCWKRKLRDFLATFSFRNFFLFLLFLHQLYTLCKVFRLLISSYSNQWIIAHCNPLFSRRH